MHRATVARAVAATATRRNQPRLPQMNMILSTREARKQTDNVLYVYAIPIVILPVIAAARKLSNVTGCHVARRCCEGVGGGIPANAAAGARHRHAGRREPEWLQLRQMSLFKEGSRRNKTGGTTRGL